MGSHRAAGGGRPNAMLAMLTAYRSDYWPRFKNLVLMLFGAWIVLFFLTNEFMKPLNKIVVPGLEIPLGFYMPVQAAVILFAVMVFRFARATR
jgi:putative solute:sodium symporter small subunit